MRSAPLLPTALLLLSASATAQQAVPDAARAADSVLTACVAAAEAGRLEDAFSAAARAERMLRDLMSNPSTAVWSRNAMARVLLQCRRPSLSFVEQGGALYEAMELLRGALARDSTYLPARFTLALAMARSPAMLGLHDNAVALLEQLAISGAPPAGSRELGEVLITLGDLYAAQERRRDAARVWRRGSTEFPRDPRFAARLATMPPEAPGAAADSVPPSSRGPTMTLDALVVTVAAPDAQERRSGRAVTSLDVVTAPGGTADLFQALQTLPGVTGGSESSDLVLRGGDPTESPVFLNGARLVYASKFESLHGGMFGVLDPVVLSTTRLYAGGFSARFGDALSGVIDVSAVGRPDGRTWRVSANSAGLGVTVQSPLGSGTGAWLTARGTHTGLLLAMHGRSGEFTRVPVAMEGMAGATRSGARGELRAVSIVESDEGARRVTAGGYTGGYEARGSTVAAILSGRRSRVGRLSNVRGVAALTERHSSLRFGALDRSRTLRRLGLDADAQWLAGAAMLVRAGVQAALLAEQVEGQVPTTGSYDPAAPVRVMSGETRRAEHVGAFSEAQAAPLTWLTVTGGLRADQLPGEARWTVDPRLGATASDGAWTLALSAGVFQQGRFRATVDQPGSDTRLGVARRARHVVASVERRGSATVRLDAYVKRYNRWIDADTALQPSRGDIWGAELLVAATGRGRSGWLTYGLSHGRLALPGGVIAPTAFDVAHSLVAVGRLQLAPGWDVGTTVRWATGRPFTPVVGSAAGADSTAPLEPVLGAPNGDRYPAYARVDARLTRYLTLPTGLLLCYAEAINLAGRDNVIAYGYDETFTVRRPVSHFFSARTIVLGMEARF